MIIDSNKAVRQLPSLGSALTTDSGQQVEPEEAGLSFQFMPYSNHILDFHVKS